MVQPLTVSSTSTTLETGRPLRVAFFLGSDVTAHCVVNRLVPPLLSRGHTVHLMHTYGRAKSGSPAALRELFFLEHTLLQEHAYPYIDQKGVPDPGQPNTPNGWRALSGTHDVHVHDVAQVNDPEFVDSLDELRLDLAVSVRCYQRFKPPIIDRLGGPDQPRLLNLHPWLLPRYRGVMTALRSMQDGAPESGFTLHVVEPEFDTGAILGRAVCPLDYSRSVLENMCLNFRSAADLILGMLYEISAETPVAPVAQDPAQAQYYSYAGSADLEELSTRGIDLFRTDAVVDLICEVFGGRLPDAQGLRRRLHEALGSYAIPVQR